MTIKDTAERQWDRKNAWARKESLISMEGMALANLNIGWLKAKADVALVEATANIDTTIARARHQIELMEEYRTQLIADVVTGKIDVREAKP